jgi:hypothetical protein
MALRLTMGVRMKLVIFGLITAFGFSAQAALETRERIVKAETHEINVEVKEGDVRCSSLGYGQMELKMSVPDLKYISPLDHTNEGELLPCMTAGRCRAGNMPTDLINGMPGIENTTLHRVLKEVVVLDRTTGRCTRNITESVTMKVRGKDFRHVRSLDLGDHPIALCETH